MLRTRKEVAKNEMTTTGKGCGNNRTIAVNNGVLTIVDSNPWNMTKVAMKLSQENLEVLKDRLILLRSETSDVKYMVKDEKDNDKFHKEMKVRGKGIRKEGSKKPNKYNGDFIFEVNSNPCFVVLSVYTGVVEYASNSEDDKYTSICLDSVILSYEECQTLKSIIDDALITMF